MSSGNNGNNPPATPVIKPTNPSTEGMPELTLPPPMQGSTSNTTNTSGGGTSSSQTQGDGKKNGKK